MNIKASETLGFAIDRASALNTYWNFYIAVTTAVVGIMATEQQVVTGTTLKVVLTSAFILFAGSNLFAIIHLGKLRRALLDMLREDRERRVCLSDGNHRKPAPNVGSLFMGWQMVQRFVMTASSSAAVVGFGRFTTEEQVDAAAVLFSAAFEIT